MVHFRRIFLNTINRNEKSPNASSKYVFSKKRSIYKIACYDVDIVRS